MSEEEHSLEQKEPHKGKRVPWTLREFGGKTVWDWMGLLIVPLMLALITVVFTWQQDARQQRIENQRAAAERELAEQRAQDEALQAYLDQMSSLLLEKDLRESEEDSEVRTLARARTFTVLSRLDPSRKADVMQFLIEADLVQSVDGRGPIISLSGADLSDTDLIDAYLYSADLSGADLNGANLNNADLIDANLNNANLIDANLILTELRGAGLSDADLSDANLNNANLIDANLIEASLNRADLYGAFLVDADLIDANLNNANLIDADLSEANLSAATGITNEKLERQAFSLKGATMPNGQKYEDWLKSRGDGDSGS